MNRRLMEYVLATPWLLPEQWLRFVLEVALGERELEDLAPRAAVQFRDGEPFDDESTVVIRDGVAIVPIIGPLTKRANLFSRVSGMTSYELLARDVVAVADSGRVNAMLLDIDSPGGAVHGVDEAEEAIGYAASKMPVIAHSGGLATSAAYWLASRADVRIGTELTFWGSIGARMTFIDDRKRLEQEGLKVIDIVSSVSPKKVADPATEDGRSEIQTIVDDVGATFVARVAKNLGVSEDKVLSDFGQGGILVGTRAKRAGLVDQIGTFESALALAAERGRAGGRRNPVVGGGFTADASLEGDMAEHDKPKPAADVAAPADEGKDQEQETEAMAQPTITAAYLREHHSDVVAEIERAATADTEARIATARTEAVAAERERIAKIMAKAQPGQDKLVAELIASGATLEAAYEKLLDDVTAKREQKRAALMDDEEDVKGVAATASATGAAEAPADPYAEAEAKAKVLMENEPGLTKAQAIDRVFQAEPDLYTRYVKTAA